MSAKDMIQQPSLKNGWYIFASRPLSLIITLIVAIVIVLVSFMLLTFPAIAGYFYAVRNSQREQFFIDLPAIIGTTGQLLRGMKRHFFQSYLVGFLGLLPPLILFFIPVVPMYMKGEQAVYIVTCLQLLWLPAFFMFGTIVFYGYPYLTATNSAIASLSYAYEAGWQRKFLTTFRGFLLLCPFLAWILHFFMVFSYPVITGWALGTSADMSESPTIPAEMRQVTPAKVLLVLLIALACVGMIFVLVPIIGGAGLFIPMILLFVLMIILTTKKVI